jgi:hypothetical protein
MSTVKSKKLQVGTDASASNNFTIYQPATPDGTLRIGVGNADSPTEVGQFNANGYKPATAPAFRAALDSNQSVSATTWTKLQLDREDFDSTGDYDNTTNYRFTPSVAGYYMCSCGIVPNVAGRSLIRLYKNGSPTASLGDIDSTFTRGMSGASLVYLNGTTDYIEFYVWRELTGNVLGTAYLSTASGVLIQQA